MKKEKVKIYKEGRKAVKPVITRHVKQEVEPMSEKLKPCPFCGGNTCIIQKDNTLREDKRTCTYQIVCSAFFGGCGASSGVFLTASEATEAWNRRDENA